MTSVVLDNVTKQYADAAPSVAGLDLHIKDGEFFTLLGPSGCGKSTTLRMVAGFVVPTSGTLRFGERDVTTVPPYKRDTGMVFQNYALFPHMDVATNVAFGLRMRKTSKSERGQRVAEALDVVGLTGYGERRIDQLSGGQQQRVALARALVINPSVLLLDEPLSNLDAKLREETRAHIRSIQQASATTSLYVTHDQAEAMAMSDRIAVMSAGHLHQVGTPREVYRRPATSFVARFIGRSNVLGGTLLGRDERTHTVRLSNGELLTVPNTENSPTAHIGVEEDIAVSIRPEDLRVVSTGSTDAGTLRGRVSAVEYTGASCTVTLNYGETQLLATVPDGPDIPAVDELVSVQPAVDRLWSVVP